LTLRLPFGQGSAGRRARGDGVGVRIRGVARHLDGVVLEERIREKLRAHLVHAPARVLFRGRIHVDLDELAHAQAGDVVKPEPAKRALHGGALRIEDAGLQPHEHPHLHGARRLPTTRRYTSWYASSTPPRAWRNRSLSSFWRVFTSQRRHVSG